MLKKSFKNTLHIPGVNAALDKQCFCKGFLGQMSHRCCQGGPLIAICTDVGMTWASDSHLIQANSCGLLSVQSRTAEGVSDRRTK